MTALTPGSGGEPATATLPELGWVPDLAAVVVEDAEGRLRSADAAIRDQDVASYYGADTLAEVSTASFAAATEPSQG